MFSLPHSPWSDSPEEVATALQTDPIHGLTSEEAKHRLSRVGENIFESAKGKSLLSILLHQFASPLIIMLGVAVVITAVLGEFLDSAIIALAILVNTALGFYQELKAEKAIADLRSYITERTRVIRDGHEMEIDPRLLVPGDILHINNGARITADARIIKEISFTTDEAILTGESLPVEKEFGALPETTLLPERINMVFAGTLNVDGSAYAMVTATGYQTEIGKLALLVDETVSEKTPLQQALSQLTWVIIFVASFAVIGIFILGILQNQPLYEMLVISIAILVGSVPEALPIGLTAILAIGVERIAKRKGIMRSLTAAETLGSTTLIITDKTGTLTQANMRLIDIDTTNHLLAPDFTPANHQDNFDVEQKEILLLARCASNVVIENPEDNYVDWIISGNDLESNIVRAGGQHGVTQNDVDRSEVQIRIPFSSKYKFSVTRIPNHFLPGHLSQYEDPHVVMGAPDILLQRAHLTHEDRERLLKAVEEHSHYGRRVLGVALLTPHTEPSAITTDHVQNITFLGVLSFVDPIRPDVPDALRRINSYGTRVIMATGDLPGTALAVANELGWNITDANVLTGTQVQQLSDEDLTAILDKIHVYARVTPEDKLRITKLHQANGAVVAMTGDGVNDSPSLKAANIGIAVGSGSDVAKSVADLILLDDSFQTIVATIEEGKQILANIKKMFVYLMSNALDQVILIGGAVIAGVALPLTAAQIIWVNLFTGSLPAFAFAFDRQQMREGDGTNKKFFDKRVIFLTTLIGVINSLLLFGLYIGLLAYGLPEELAQNITFACFGSYVLFMAFSFIDISRPIFSYSIIKNKVLLLGVGIGVFLMTSTFSVPALREIFQLQAIPLPWITLIVAFIVVSVTVVELLKWIANRFLVPVVDKQTNLS
jgi:P-type Ca2+ transporter type 2C